MKLLISEVEIKGGSAFATAYHPGRWAPENAFSAGELAWGGFQVTFPAIVWYKFPANATFPPARVSFQARADPTAAHGVHTDGPVAWQFLGSNDPVCGRFGNWTVLCEDTSNAPFPSPYWTKYCDVHEATWTPFHCLGISVWNTESPAGNVALRNVRMWRKVAEYV